VASSRTSGDILDGSSDIHDGDGQRKEGRGSEKNEGGEEHACEEWEDVRSGRVFERRLEKREGN
jgi:hypothetical protein